MHPGWPVPSRRVQKGRSMEHTGPLTYFLGEADLLEVAPSPLCRLALCTGSADQGGPSLCIDGPAHCYAFADYALPASPGTLLSTQVDVLCGHHAGNAWGPGIALCWPGGRFVRVNVRADGRYGVDDGRRTIMAAVTPEAGWATLRIRLTPVDVVAEASAGLNLWALLAAFPRERYWGNPSVVRLGKMSRWATAQDFHRPGPRGHTIIRSMVLMYLPGVVSHAEVQRCTTLSTLEGSYESRLAGN